MLKSHPWEFNIIMWLLTSANVFTALQMGLGQPLMQQPGVCWWQAVWFSGTDCDRHPLLAEKRSLHSCLSCMARRPWSFWQIPWQSAMLTSSGSLSNESYIPMSRLCRNWWLQCLARTPQTSTVYFREPTLASLSSCNTCRDALIEPEIIEFGEQRSVSGEKGEERERFSLQRGWRWWVCLWGVRAWFSRAYEPFPMGFIKAGLMLFGGSRNI